MTIEIFGWGRRGLTYCTLGGVLPPQKSMKCLEVKGCLGLPKCQVLESSGNLHPRYGGGFKFEIVLNGRCALPALKGD